MRHAGRTRSDGTAVEVDTTEDKNATERAEDRQCWLTFSTMLVLGIGFVSLWVYSVGSFGVGIAVNMHSFEYFVLCAVGGVLSGLPHTMTVPMDLVKCRVQCGEYASAMEGYSSIWAEGVGQGTLYRVSLFFRGWGPTLIGYSFQGAAKFGLYEFFKHFYAGIVGHEMAAEHRAVLFLTASACGEVFADILLAPWEAVKVKMQTTRATPPVLAIVVPRIWYVEGFSGFFKGLVPLWSRQVPYTMIKFVAFEKIIEFVYTFLVTVPKASLPKSQQLAISMAAGFLAGLLCAVVSHPADSVVSKLNQKSDNRQSLAQVVQEMGCQGLWRGLPLRLLMIGTITATQWVIYDAFKVFVGLPTTGGAAHHHHHPLTSAPVVGGVSLSPAG
jgi:solute carrier family 25 phosphate transporter 3